MTFDRTVVGDVTVLAPKKNLVGKEETQELLAAIDEVAAKGTPKVVVDLGKIYVPLIFRGAAPKVEAYLVERVRPNLERVGPAVERLLSS